MTSFRTAKEGGEIIKKIKDRGVNPGGNGVEFVGASGSGKTSAFFNFMGDFLQNDKTLIFWRDSLDTPLQFVKHPRYNILVEKGLDITILDQNNGGEKVDMPMKRFDEIPKIDYKTETAPNPGVEEVRENEKKKKIQDEVFENICEKSKRDEINVIFFKKLSSWIDFIRYLKEQPEWHDVFIDEYEDIFPANPSGEEWHMVEWAAKNLKQIRKGLVNVFCNTQQRHDVDYRIRKKMTIWGYMTGGVPDNDSPVKSEAVRSLKIGEAYLDWKRSKFGKVEFNPHYADKDTFYVAKHERGNGGEVDNDGIGVPDSSKKQIDEGVLS